MLIENGLATPPQGDMVDIMMSAEGPTGSINVGLPFAVQTLTASKPVRKHAPRLGLGVSVRPCGLEHETALVSVAAGIQCLEPSPPTGEHHLVACT